MAFSTFAAAANLKTVSGQTRIGDFSVFVVANWAMHKGQIKRPIAGLYMLLIIKGRKDSIRGKNNYMLCSKVNYITIYSFVKLDKF